MIPLKLRLKVGTRLGVPALSRVSRKQEIKVRVAKLVGMLGVSHRHAEVPALVVWR